MAQAQHILHVVCLAQIYATLHGLDLAYVPCGTSQPSLCVMWHGLGLTQVPCGIDETQLMCHVACPMSCLNAIWNGLDLTYVAYFMPCLNATWHGLGLTYVPHVMFSPICRHKQMPHVTKPRLGTMWPRLIGRQVFNKQVGRY